LCHDIVKKGRQLSVTIGNPHSYVGCTESCSYHHTMHTEKCQTAGSSYRFHSLRNQCDGPFQAFLRVKQRATEAVLLVRDGKLCQVLALTCSMASLEMRFKSQFDFLGDRSMASSCSK
jgi:hypothetical protein